MFIDTMAISALTAVLTQLLKKLIPYEGVGPFLVAAVSLVATIAWIASQPVWPTRADFFGIISTWAGIALAAVGQYELMKKTVEAIPSEPRRTQAVRARGGKRDDDQDPSWLPDRSS